MNLSFEKIIVWVKGLAGPKGVVHTRPIATPVRDWKTLLLSGSIAIGMCGIFSFFVYLNAHDTVPPEDAGGPTILHSKVKEAEIKNTLSAFTLRAQTHTQLQTQGEGLVDPSQ